MPYSYSGRFLQLDLDSSEWHIEDMEDSLIEKYLLGGGLAAKFYHDGMEPSRGPLDPESSLILMIGARRRARLKRR